MVMADISSFFGNLESMGFFDYLLPFVLIFAIIFAILEKIHLFGQNKTNIHVIIALMLGLLFTTQFDIVQRMNLFLPKISFFIVLVLMFLILIGLLGAKVELGLSGAPFFISVLVCLFALWWALGDEFGFELPQWMQDASWWGQALLIIGIIAVVVFAAKGAADKEKNSFGAGFNTFVDNLRGEGGSHK